MPSRRALGLWLVAVAGCAPSGEVPGKLVRSTHQRLTTAAPAGDVSLAVQDANELTLKLFHSVPGTGNVALAPWSAELTLAMASAGAAGTTKDAFAAVLHPSLPDDRFHAAMNTLDRALERRATVARDAGTLVLDVQNELFTQTDQHLEAPFLDTLAELYGAGVHQLDFAHASEAARKDLNAWINAATGGVIPELLAPGSVTPDTRLALVNTLYFEARWATPFGEATTNRPFTRGDGSVVQVPMMKGWGVASAVAHVDGTDVLELGYRGGDVSMAVLVPPLGNLASFEQSLTASSLAALLGAAHSAALIITLPRFSADTRASLKEAVSALGLGVAFSADADFSGMTGAMGLSLCGVEHRAVVRVDEAGTVAAAATFMPVAGSTAIPEHVDVNRPFVFVVRDDATGLVLFLGHVVDP